MRWRPPELQKACDRKQDAMEASTAADIWAFGVMGYEILTEKSAFAPGMPRGTMRRMLIGRAPLPWEDHSNSADLTDDISDNELKGIVLSCLARKPDIRPTAEALALTLQKLVNGARERAEVAAAAAARAATAAALAAPPVKLARPAVRGPGRDAGFFDTPLPEANLAEDDAPADDDVPAYEDEGLKVGPAGLAVAARDEEDDSVFDTGERFGFDSMQFGAALGTLSGSKLGSRVGSRVASRAPSGGLADTSGGLILGDELAGTGPIDDSVTAAMW